MSAALIMVWLDPLRAVKSGSYSLVIGPQGPVGPIGGSVADDIEFVAATDGAQAPRAFAGTRARVYLDGLLLPSTSHTIAGGNITILAAANARAGDPIRISAY